MECITDRQRKMLFSLVGCYSKTVYNSVDSYYTNLALEELKKVYAEKVISPATTEIGDLDNRIDRLYDRLEKYKDKDTKKLILADFAKREVKLFLLREKKTFSISRDLFSKEAASNFINWLIGYFIENEIELTNELIKMLDEQDKERFIYACLINKKCCICGREVSFPHHHTSINAIGGYKKDDGSIPVVPLCKYHHSELHSSINKWVWIKQHSNYGYITCSPEQIKKLQKIYKGLFLKDKEEHSPNE